MRVDPLNLEQDDRLLLCGQRPNLATGNLVRYAAWYRVVSVATADGQTYLTLDGPDWPYGTSVQVVHIPSVIGVYTSMVNRR
jgi:hypothetical protein